MNLENLKSNIEEGHKFEYCFFYGGPFSQWYPCEFTYNGIQYNCIEQFMMAKKAEIFEDDKALQAILKSDNSDFQKKLGRQIKNFDERIWSECRNLTVLLGNLEKFSQNFHLKEKLISTGDRILVEASPYDQIWGIGLGINHPDHKNPFKWRGKNLLGFLLMEVRNQLNYENQTRNI